MKTSGFSICSVMLPTNSDIFNSFLPIETPFISFSYSFLKKKKIWLLWLGIQRVKVLVTQSCPTLYDPMDCSPSGSSVHGVLQARILGWVVISFSRGFSWPRNWTQCSCITGRFFTIWATRNPNNIVNRSGRSGHPCLIHDLGGKASAFHHWVW